MELWKFTKKVLSFFSFFRSQRQFFAFSKLRIDVSVFNRIDRRRKKQGFSFRNQDTDIFIGRVY